MRILFDFKTTQSFVGGASEYTRRVFYTLLDIIEERKLNVELIGLIDSRVKNFAYPDLSPDSLNKYNIDIIDIANKNLKDIIISQSIDKIFIGCGQTWNKFDLHNINIPVICVIHDIWNEEFFTNHLDDLLLLNHGLWYLLKHRLKLIIKRTNLLSNNKQLIEMIHRNSNSVLVTVSEFSRLSISYAYGIPPHNIKVLYSPYRMNRVSAEIENNDLRTLISKGIRYYLMLSANRRNKNAYKAFKAFEQYVRQVDPNAILVTTGCHNRKFDNHICMPYLSESDLVYAMKNCYALIFPSIFEGFGYPPVEAMSFGKPVLVSNTSSIPEVCKEAAIYFSPFFESDIYRSLVLLDEKSYSSYQNKAQKRFQELKMKQESDLIELIELILHDSDN